jgi:hypothetical protein
VYVNYTGTLLESWSSICSTARANAGPLQVPLRYYSESGSASESCWRSGGPVCSSLIARLLRHRRFCSSEILESLWSGLLVGRQVHWQVPFQNLKTPALALQFGSRGTATDALAAVARMGTSAGLAPARPPLLLQSALSLSVTLSWFHPVVPSGSTRLIRAERLGSLER